MFVKLNYYFWFSDPSHTLNVDITSPVFTDVNVRYAARRDGVSASVSTPTTGHLGLQLGGKIPSQMRIYSRYAVSGISLLFLQTELLTHANNFCFLFFGCTCIILLSVLYVYCMYMFLFLFFFC